MSIERTQTIRLKRTRKNPSQVSSTELYFGEPLVIDTTTLSELIVGTPSSSSSETATVSNSKAVKLLKQSVTDPEDSTKTINMPNVGVHYKDKAQVPSTGTALFNKAKMTDDAGNTLYPESKMSVIYNDAGTMNAYDLSMNKVSLDGTRYIAAGYDTANGFYFTDFTPESSNIPGTFIALMNKKASIDGNYQISLGEDISGIYAIIED